MKEETTTPERRSFTRRTITRADRFRKMIKRKGSADSASRTSKDVPQDGDVIDTQANESQITQVPKQTKDKPLLAKQDSVDDEDDVTVRDDVIPRDVTPADEISHSERDNEEGINDSITNMSLFTNFMYSFVSSVSGHLWTLLRTAIGFLVNTLTGNNQHGAHAQGTPAVDGQVPDKKPDKPEPSPDDAARHRRLYNIAKELLTTEEQYVKRLGVLVILKSQTTSILQADVAKAMFQNIEVIHQFHHDNLLPELQQRIENWETIQKIGDIMKKLTPFLKLYTEYVKNMETANNLLISWRQKNSAFEKLMTEAENNDAYGRLKVQAHMLEPVQRVPRYELLLRDYLRKLPDDSPDREDSQKALTLVSEAASHFEEMMKRDSRVVVLMQLQTQFEGGVNVVHPDRELRHKGKLKAISTKTGKISEKVIHLFNDMVLISSEGWTITGDRYKPKYNFNLNHTRIGYGLNLEVNHVFYLSSRGTVVELVASDNEERLEWMERIDKELQSCAEKNNMNHASIPTRKYSYEMQWAIRKQVLQMSSDNGKSWKRRTLAIYENGLMSCYKNHSDKQPMSVVHLSDYHIALGSIPQKKGQVCTLVGEGKTYHLHDDNKALVEKFYETASPFQMSCEEEAITREFASLRRETPPDAVSIDSGIDIQAVRLSGASTDSELSWSRLSAISLESDVNNENDVTKESLDGTPGQRISGVSTDSGFTDNTRDNCNQDEADVTVTSQSSDITSVTSRDSTQC